MTQRSGAFGLSPWLETGQCAELGMKRHNLQPSFRESSDSLRQQAASTNLPMPSTPAFGNGVYALALAVIGLPRGASGQVGTVGTRFRRREQQLTSVENRVCHSDTMGGSPRLGRPLDVAP